MRITSFFLFIVVTLKRVIGTTAFHGITLQGKFIIENQERLILVAVMRTILIINLNQASFNLNSQFFCVIPSQ